jgi:DNA replication protein DnaC
MYTAESVIDTQLEHAASKDLSTTEVLDQLLDTEVKARKSSAIETCTRLSGFPVKKTLDEFDLSYQPSIDKSVFDDLLRDPGGPTPI